MSEEAKRGRPPLKKGKPTWKPASVHDVVGKDPSKRYRLLNKDPDNLMKKKAEGWEIETGLTSGNAELKPDGSMATGKSLTSAYERRDVILASMPEELAQARDEYMNAETARRTMGLTANLKKEIGRDASIHGKITISSLKGGENEQTID
jgi:hypothetical protein